MTTLTVDLPDDLAQRVEAAGLLRPPVLQALLSRELREREEALKSFDEHTNRLRQLGGEPMSMDEINAIVREVRAKMREERANDARGG